MRLRAGIGYRRSFAWGYEVLYIWNGTRNAGSGPLVTQSRALDIRIIRTF